MCALAHEYYMKTLQALIQGVSSLIKHLIRSNRRRGRCRAIASLLVRGTNSRIRKGEDDAELVFRSFSPSLSLPVSLNGSLSSSLSPTVSLCVCVSPCFSAPVSSCLPLSIVQGCSNQTGLSESTGREMDSTQERLAREW